MNAANLYLALLFTASAAWNITREDENTTKLDSKNTVHEKQAPRSNVYTVTVLVPIACGIVLAVIIVGMAFVMKTCNEKTNGTKSEEEQQQEVEETVDVDQVVLLADSSDEESLY
ncbi:DgyrCDS2253 [Dimorphilus gyrociliatus]|uniref:DgyrCDS2253 n=1 Tax=Dimorphilus gyrociliatus TaxID=2664684 RepID=A0A7I8V9Q2_9ANNE|nr:DgyrCDS2253 [Dimorphilus gyrociliatus]